MKWRKLHPWQVTPPEAVGIQKKLAEKIELRKFRKRIRLVAGLDCAPANSPGLMRAAVAVLAFPQLEVVEKKVGNYPVSFPYVPGLLTFREGPALLSCLRKLKIVPDVFLCDGQGIAHPRKMGLATHLGILLDKPTVGCAKSVLWGEFTPPGFERGKYTYITSRTGEIIGACLRTREKVKPVLVSPGYKIDLASAIRLVLSCAPKYRIPEPLRQAHALSKCQSAQVSR